MTYRQKRLRQLILDSALQHAEGVMFNFERVAGKNYTSIEMAVAESIIKDQKPYIHECLKIMNFINAFYKVYPAICYLHRVKMAFLYYKDSNELLYVFVDEMDNAIEAMEMAIKKF